jgi:hypothetical protein
MRRWSDLAAHRRTAATSGARRWAGVGVVGMLIGGCATAPPPPPPPPPAPVETAVREPVCPTCEDASGELARLRQELASRETELRDLRAQQRDQARALQETTKQADRAKVKLRRFATQADAASYLAEVEVALAAARSTPAAGARNPLLSLAQEILDSSAAPFTHGDYGAAMDLAGQAEQLAATAAGVRARPASAPRKTADMPFAVTIPLRVRIESNLRRQPRDKGPPIGVLPEGTLLVARAYHDGWLRVETEDGRSGWIYQSLVGTR